MRWGYHPWLVGQEAHHACTRLGRADYCGDGSAWTREGTLVNVYDTLGVQVSETTAKTSFEAAWGADGAVCVRERRYQIRLDSGARVRPACWDHELSVCTPPETESQPRGLGTTMGPKIPNPPPGI